jgi:hypothetical protein
MPTTMTAISSQKMQRHSLAWFISKASSPTRYFDMDACNIPQSAARIP